MKRTSEEANLSAFTNSGCKSLKVKTAGTRAMCQHAHGWRGPMQCQHAVTWGSHSAWAHPKVNNPRGAILSGFSPSRCPQILTALTTDQNHSEETDLGALLHQSGSRPHPWQGSDNHRAKGKFSSISRGGLGHNNSNQSQDQGGKGRSLWNNLTP